jgi:hypothetical protein
VLGAGGDFGTLIPVLGFAVIFAAALFGFAALIVWQAAPINKDVVIITSAIQSALNAS